uniref:ORF33 n=1 Tax=Nitrosopumilaceae spindle-shaped virus TaxID=3065433 RepID=A0AAT9JAF9_9VIRU
MSKFIIFVIGKNFSKVVNEYFVNKTIIKWEILDKINLNNQQEILFEYSENP